MTSKILNCGYDPTSGTNYKQINPLDPLKQHGTYDISCLVYDITTKDLGYAGSNKYTLTLKNTEMVLTIWDKPDGSATHEFAKLEFKNGQWVKADGTPLADSAAASNRLAQTLDRVSKAASDTLVATASPAIAPSQPHLPAQATIGAQSGPHPQLNDLQKTIEQLSNNISKLKQDDHLQGIHAILIEIPKQLSDIRASIDALGRVLDKSHSRSDEQQLLVQTLKNELVKAQNQTTALNEELSKLKLENAQLASEYGKENQALKNQIATLQLNAETQKNQHLAELEQQKQMADTTIKSLEQQITSFSSDLNKALERAKTLHDNLNDLTMDQEARIKELSRQLADAKQAQQGANETSRLEAHLKALTKQLDEERKARQAAESKSTLLQALNDQLQQQDENISPPNLTPTSALTGSASTNGTSPLSIPSGSDSSTDLRPFSILLEKTMGSSASLKQVGAILVNLAYLGELPEESKINSWIKNLFTGITDQQISDKKTSIKLRYPPSDQYYSEKIIAKIFGDLETDMDHIKTEIGNTNASKLPIETRLNLVHSLVTRKDHLKLVIKQFDEIKKTRPKDYLDRQELMNARRSSADAFVKNLETELSKIKEVLNKKRNLTK